MVVDDKIKAFFLAKRFKTHYSLSYYYVDEDLRKKISSLFFFLHAFNKFKKLPIYIKTNKNFADYERYFEATTEDKIYKFKGLREDGAWAELLKP